MKKGDHVNYLGKECVVTGVEDGKLDLEPVESSSWYHAVDPSEVEALNTSTEPSDDLESPIDDVYDYDDENDYGTTEPPEDAAPPAEETRASPAKELRQKKTR